MHLFLYKLMPYGIATAHAGALHLTNISDWLHSVLIGVACVAGVHVLTVLLRLVFLRPRFFSDEAAL
jgi:hypothetical protein